MRKRKVLFTVAIATLLATSQLAFANKIASHNEMLSALKSNKTVYAVIDVSKCKYKPGYEDKYGIKSVGVRVDHLWERDATRSDGAKMRVIGYADHSWYGHDQYYLSRTLLRVWQDGEVELINDEVDPTTYKLQHRSWLQCKLTANGSGGVTLDSKVK